MGVRLVRAGPYLSVVVRPLAVLAMCLLQRVLPWAVLLVRSLSLLVPVAVVLVRRPLSALAIRLPVLAASFLCKAALVASVALWR
jgi:hypothetical protein